MTGALGSSVAGAAPTTLRVAIGKIANAPTPFSTNDAGSLQILANVGEYLSWSNDKSEIVPRVAESWKASGGGKIWTLREFAPDQFIIGGEFTNYIDPNANNTGAQYLLFMDSAGAQITLTW